MDNIKLFKIALKEAWKDRKVFWKYFENKKYLWKFPMYWFGGVLDNYEQLKETK